MIILLKYYLLYLRTYLIIRRKQWINWLSVYKDNAYIPFVILSEPRSGSTLLHTYLNSHTQVKSYGEVLRENLERQTENIPGNHVLEQLAFKPHTQAIKAVGLKMFYEYADHPLYKPAFRGMVSRKDIRVIHLVRHSTLKVYVSLKIAQQTKKWSSSNPALPTSQTRIEVDFADYERFALEHQKHQEVFGALLKDHRVLKVSYEDLVSDANKTLLAVQHFINVRPQRLFSLLKKQNPDDLSLLVSNYDALRKRYDVN